jgi:hypothetical protein
MPKVPRGKDSGSGFRPIRGNRQYESLTRTGRRAHGGAREVVSYSRENRVGIYQAIRDLRSKGARTSIGSVRKYWGNAVELDWRGRLVAKRTDPNLAVMKPLTTVGPREVYVVGSKNRSIVAEHEESVRALLSGDPSKMAVWKAEHGGKAFRGVDARLYALETDPDEIEERDARGEISYEDLYPEVA